jgi:hypothetical protein
MGRCTAAKASKSLGQISASHGPSSVTPRKLGPVDTMTARPSPPSCRRARRQARLRERPLRDLAPRTLGGSEPSAIRQQSLVLTRPAWTRGATNNEKAFDMNARARGRQSGCDLVVGPIPVESARSLCLGFGLGLGFGLRRAPPPSSPSTVRPDALTRSSPSSGRGSTRKSPNGDRATTTSSAARPNRRSGPIPPSP